MHIAYQLHYTGSLFVNKVSLKFRLKMRYFVALPNLSVGMYYIQNIVAYKHIYFA